eukprot:TRINITY_DN4865_c0_g1_i2.p1 TRINITY_DN4865_c0_g1~~TRINITY_DN4865_c0_g1_i2.p1  ORF type:complete len:132 (-),score=29.10 TRINITY_DN4865_c0_g1_i2:80-475(-)
MSLRYVLLANQGKILLDLGSRTSFSPIVDQLLEKSPLPDQRKSYQHEQFSFNYVSDGPLLLLCVSDNQLPSSECFSFLDSLLSNYKSEKDLSKIKILMRQGLEKYSPGFEKINEVKKKVEEVRITMIENIG